ncbi:uncharacterized protein DS421_16g553120 [Arachis hypogaea]|nr:uncharacterized protein DS421_16g553120 [Arachis hypogaea]
MNGKDRMSSKCARQSYLKSEEKRRGDSKNGEERSSDDPRRGGSSDDPRRGAKQRRPTVRGEEASTARELEEGA